MASQEELRKWITLASKNFDDNAFFNFMDVCKAHSLFVVRLLPAN